MEDITARAKTVSYQNYCQLDFQIKEKILELMVGASSNGMQQVFGIHTEAVNEFIRFGLSIKKRIENFAQPGRNEFVVQPTNDLQPDTVANAEGSFEFNVADNDEKSVDLSFDVNYDPVCDFQFGAENDIESYPYVSSGVLQEFDTVCPQSTYFPANHEKCEKPPEIPTTQGKMWKQIMINYFKTSDPFEKIACYCKKETFLFKTKNELREHQLSNLNDHKPNIIYIFPLCTIGRGFETKSPIHYHTTSLIITRVLGPTYKRCKK